jgi:hypothetical protein
MANKLKWKKWVQYKIVDYAQRGMAEGATNIYTESQKQTPLDDGELVNGARVSTEGDQSDHFVAMVSYGNDEVSKEYAVIQHEDLTLNHPNGGNAKFLENAFTANSNLVLARIRQEIRNIII